MSSYLAAYLAYITRSKTEKELSNQKASVLWAVMLLADIFRVFLGRCLIVAEAASDKVAAFSIKQWPNATWQKAWIEFRNTFFGRSEHLPSFTF